jgi:hypothetical protein
MAQRACFTVRMAQIAYSERETATVLRLPNAAALEALVADGTLRIAAVAVDGRRFFFAQDVRRAASELAYAARAERRKAKRV